MLRCVPLSNETSQQYIGNVIPVAATCITAFQQRGYLNTNYASNLLRKSHENLYL